MNPWYKIATPRKEVRQGRSFNPDEFASHLEQVVAGTPPEDYRDPKQFFARTCLTRALREHAGMVLRVLRIPGTVYSTVYTGWAGELNCGLRIFPAVTFAAADS